MPSIPDGASISSAVASAAAPRRGASGIRPVLAERGRRLCRRPPPGCAARLSWAMGFRRSAAFSRSSKDGTNSAAGIARSPDPW